LIWQSNRSYLLRNGPTAWAFGNLASALFDRRSNSFSVFPRRFGFSAFINFAFFEKQQRENMEISRLNKISVLSLTASPYP
ncbi:MAG: hypothetical protein AAF766_21470, partial [Cyanobacteria bacterium P01_D01_bin.14]